MDKLALAETMGQVLRLFTELRELEKRQADYLEEIIEEQRKQTALMDELYYCARRK